LFGISAVVGDVLCILSGAVGLAGDSNDFAAV
jgi:hypothetical protein